jgi:hypothetical protein
MTTLIINFYKNKKIMKKILFIAVALVAVLFTACSTDDYTEVVVDQPGEKTFTVNFGGEFQFESFTRATVSEDNAQDIWIFDYMDGHLVQTARQSNGYIGFGSPKITLKYGKHDLYFVVSAGYTPNLMAAMHVISWQQLGDTFWTHTAIEVNASTSPNLSVRLNRVVTMLKLKSTDVVPDNAKYVKVVPAKWYYGIDYLTGQPSTYSTNRANIYNMENTGSPTEIILYGISGYEETKVEIGVFAMSKSEGVIKYNKLESVPFRANRITTMSGSIFGNAGGITGSYTLITNSTWNSGYAATW